MALVETRDDLAPRAARDLRRLRARPFASTANVLGETFFLLPTPTLRHRLRFLIDRLSVEVLELPAGWWGDVLDWMERYEEHEPDLADAQLAILCSRKPDHAVWTYDDEFRAIWRRTDGSRIPLAVRAGPRRAQ